ncbi:MAG: FG-GAP repeat domain-containing protein [Halobacteriota archaeon]
MEFEHIRIDDDPPCGRLAFCQPHDLTGNGLPDVIVGGLGDTTERRVLGKRIQLRHLPVTGHLIKRLESNVFWYENPGWKRHEVARAPDLGVGASLVDLTGNGRVDLVDGQNLGHELYWFEQPSDPRDRWTRHLITDEFHKYHDTAIGDVDDDGEPELVVLSQRSETVFYYDIPDDPYVSPWPASARHTVAEGIEVEGAAIVDIDHDGRTELIAGPNVFSRDNGGWDRDRIASGWEWTRVAVADLDGDGRNEVVISEGDRPYHDGQPGRLGTFEPPEWTPTILADSLVNPHSLQVADFTGSGLPDIYVAEMGLDMTDEPDHLLFENRGNGTFERRVIATGVPTHEAKAVDLTGDGRLDIVGKSYTPNHHVDAWIRTS